MRELMEEMLAMIAHLGLTELQEESILDLVRQKARELVRLYDLGDETQATLGQLTLSLNEMQSSLLQVARGARP